MLTTEVKTHVIVSFDGSHKYITNGEYEKIMKCQEHGMIGLELDGGFYKLSDMKKIPGIDEFYEQYPDKKPTKTPDTFNKVYKDVLKGPRKPIKNAKLRIKEGFIASEVQNGLTKKKAEEKFKRIFSPARSV